MCTYENRLMATRRKCARASESFIISATTWLRFHGIGFATDVHCSQNPPMRAHLVCPTPIQSNRELYTVHCAAHCTHCAADATAPHHHQLPKRAFETPANAQHMLLLLVLLLLRAANGCMDGCGKRERNQNNSLVNNSNNSSYVRSVQLHI